MTFIVGLKGSVLVFCANIIFADILDPVALWRIDKVLWFPELLHFVNRQIPAFGAHHVQFVVFPFIELSGFHLNSPSNTVSDHHINRVHLDLRSERGHSMENEESVTLEISTPIIRWMPAHLIHTKMPWFHTLQLLSVASMRQSAQRSFWRPSDWMRASICSFQSGGVILSCSSMLCLCGWFAFRPLTCNERMKEKEKFL